MQSFELWQCWPDCLLVALVRGRLLRFPMMGVLRRLPTMLHVPNHHARFRHRLNGGRWQHRLLLCDGGRKCSCACYGRRGRGGALHSGGGADAACDRHTKDSDGNTTGRSSCSSSGHSNRNIRSNSPNTSNGGRVSTNSSRNRTSMGRNASLIANPSCRNHIRSNNLR